MPLEKRPQRTGWHRWLPGVGSIVDGARHSVLTDARAALTGWAVVVPQSLAYATLAGVPSVHGPDVAVGAFDGVNPRITPARAIRRDRR